MDSVRGYNENNIEMKWIFFDEGKEDSPDFWIEADDHLTAFHIAYNEYGPQVESMYYKQLDEPTFYEVRDAEGEVLGTFENFEKALINKPYGGEIRYFDGQCWILKVTKAVE